jgi:hypothetical protein
LFILFSIKFYGFITQITGMGVNLSWLMFFLCHCLINLYF